MGQHQVFVRKNGMDTMTFWEVLVARIYKHALPRSTSPTIVDAGANIGLASLYFLTQRPAGRVVAVEPEPTNFSLLARNLSDAMLNGRVSLYEAALASTSGVGQLVVAEPTAHHLESVESGGSGKSKRREVSTLSLDDLAAREGLTMIDLIKVDIEGEEANIFRHTVPVLDRTHGLIMEIHNEDDRREVASVLRRQGFRHVSPPQSGLPDLFQRVAY